MSFFVAKNLIKDHATRENEQQSIEEGNKVKQKSLDKNSIWEIVYRQFEYNMSVTLGQGS